MSRIETRCVQGGYTPKNGEPRQIPIIQSTTFKYDTSEDMGKLFDLEASGYFYTRLQNPTNDMVAAKIAALEGGTAAMLTSSGQAANFFALFNICACGDHIVSSSTIYGGTFNLISVTMAKMGIEVTFVDPNCTDEALDAPIALKRLDASDPRAGALAYVGRWAGEAAGLEVEDHGVCCLFTVTVPVDAVTSHRWTYTCLYDEAAGRMASVSVSMLTVITQEEDSTAEVDEINDAGNAAFVMEDGNRLVWMSGTSAGDVVLERLAD